MPKKAKELTALEVARLAAPGLHAVGGVAGLALQVKDSGARSWSLRVMVGRARREIGLGGFPSVTLAQAREKARRLREGIEQGADPVDERRAARSALIAAQAKALTFKEASEAFIEAQEAGWRNAKHGQQWRNTLETYAYPVMGGLLVRDVAMPHVLAVLEPIWREKTETASRLRGRIEKVLDWAKGRGYRSGDNPAAWKGNLDAQLAAPRKVATVEHHPALPAAEMHAFMLKLREAAGMGARALEFAILTAARSGEVRGARWDEIDLDAKVWVIPAGRMKASKEHRVALSAAAVRLLKALPKIDGGHVFPSSKEGPLSDATLAAVLRRMDIPPDKAVPHGFRSTFRDWAGEHTSHPREVIEHALAHRLKDKAEAAYARGDLMEKRRRLMEDWAAFLARPMGAARVMSLAARRA